MQQYKTIQAKWSERAGQFHNLSSKSQILYFKVCWNKLWNYYWNYFVYFLVLYYCKTYKFEFWDVGRAKQAIWKHHCGLWELVISIFHSFLTFYRLNHHSTTCSNEWMEPQCYILWRTWLSVAVSLILWRFAVWVAVAVLDHRVVIQSLTNHLLLLGTCKGKDPSIMHRSAQLISHMNPPFRNMEPGRRVEHCV